MHGLFLGRSPAEGTKKILWGGIVFIPSTNFSQNRPNPPARFPRQLTSLNPGLSLTHVLFFPSYKAQRHREASFFSSPLAVLPNVVTQPVLLFALQRAPSTSTTSRFVTTASKRPSDATVFSAQTRSWSLHLDRPCLSVSSTNRRSHERPTR